MQLTKEDQSILRMYGALSRWEKNALFLILQSIASGKLTAKTDRMPWPKLARTIGLR